MKLKNTRLIVVLGMHRSGTSVITHGLQVMGVELGDRFLPPKGDNQKGFWEDVDINKFNIEILSAIGSNWYHLAPVNASDIEILRDEGYFLRAVELLRQKVNGVAVFGFKDPRLAKLLPFWKEVFNHCKFDVDYVLAIRHPLSVVKSLAKRDGLADEQSYLLWLGHVITALGGSTGDKRVLVDYDRLLQSPDCELTRIANRMDLKINPAKLQIYKTEFLDQGLRHTVFGLNDLLLDKACPPIVREVYDALLNVASEVTLDDQALQGKVSRWSDEFERIKSLVMLADRLFTQKRIATQAVAERDSQVARLNQAVAERDGQVASLSQAVTDRDGRIANLNEALAARERRSSDQLASIVSRLAQETSERAEAIASLNKAMTERDGQIASLNHALANRDGQIASLNKAMTERDGQIASLNKAMTERDGQIASLSLAVSERDGQITSLNLAVAVRDGQIAGLAQAVAALRNSTSWRLTKPLRFARHQFARGKHLARIARSALRMGGGPHETLKKAIGLYRREGFSGLKRGIRIVQGGGETKPAVGSDAFDRNDYAEWVRRYDTIDDAKRQKLRARCDGLASKPKISVLMPTYNPKREWLIEAIESVRNQIYPNWELCIADDASPDPSIRPILERYVREDKRIKVVFREHNGHISAASNSALEVATGEWIALLDHDDLLAEHALALVAEAINRYPAAGLIYSDEDKIDEQGNRSTPYFKCEFNIDLLRSQNMICHLGAYRGDLVRRLGGFRLGFEGSQDYDLALRVVELLEDEQIVHVPYVLYHWRIHPESTALHSGNKSYAQDSGLKALREHLQRQPIDATVELTPFLQYRIRYAIPVPSPKVSLIIPTRNGLHLIRQCIESILTKTTYKNYEVLIIDNGSDDPEALNYFASFDGNPKIRVIRDDGPFNYSALNNKAVIEANGEFVGLLNNDIEVISPGWLDEMLGLATQPGKGAVGACLWYPDGTLQHGGVITGLGGVAGHSHKRLPRGAGGHINRARLTQGMSAVTAACLIIKKSIYLEVGGLNEAELHVAFNDVDFCLKVREAGYQNVWTPFAELYHHESATRGFEDTPEKKIRFAQEVAYMKRTWGESLLNDPAYSPNLTLDHEDFSLAWPPRLKSI